MSSAAKIAAKSLNTVHNKCIATTEFTPFIRVDKVYYAQRVLLTVLTVLYITNNKELVIIELSNIKSGIKKDLSAFIKTDKMKNDLSSLTGPESLDSGLNSLALYTNQSHQMLSEDEINKMLDFFCAALEKTPQFLSKETAEVSNKLSLSQHSKVKSYEAKPSSSLSSEAEAEKPIPLLGKSNIAP